MTLAALGGRAVRDLMEPRVAVWMVASAVATMTSFLILWGALALWLVPMLTFGISWLDSIILGFGASAAVALTLALYAPLATLISGLFTDRVAGAVERLHYPDVLTRDVGVLPSVLSGFRLTVMTVGLAVVVLFPAWLLLSGTFLWVPLWLAVSGALLGREYFEVAASRRLSPGEMEELRRHARWQAWGAGTIVAIVFATPVLGLAAPCFGTSLMVHLVDRAQRTLTARDRLHRGVVENPT